MLLHRIGYSHKHLRMVMRFLDHGIQLHFCGLHFTPSGLHYYTRQVTANGETLYETSKFRPQLKYLFLPSSDTNHDSSL